MKKQGIIYHPSFVSFISRNRLSLIPYTLYFLLLLSLPGQNYYQTLTFAKFSPNVRKIPISVSKPAPLPLLNGSYPKNLTAQAVLVYDIPSATAMYTKNPNLPLIPASTTKIMTAIIALENYKLDQVITANNLTTDGASMKLENGDKLTVESLLYGLLINSANDAAIILAQNYPDGSQKFIQAMNDKAKSLNLKNTHFNNVSGLEEVYHYTTANDLALLTVYALKNPIFSKIVSIPEISVPNFNYTKWYQLKNVNKLLDEIPGVFGVKTGYTDEAGECLVTGVKRNERMILTVVLKSDDRFGETAYLIDWAFNNFYWKDY